MDINELSPSEVFSYFQEICAIPHGSGNTGMIADYCLEFAKLHGLKARKDGDNSFISIKSLLNLLFHQFSQSDRSFLHC